MNIDLSLTTSEIKVTNTPVSRGTLSNDQVDNSLIPNHSASGKQASIEKTTAAEEVYVNKAPGESIEAGKDKQQTTLNREQLENMANKLQEFVGSLNKGLEFSVDKDSGRDVIKVIDRDSKEVLRQYPSEEVLDLIANLSDAAGNFVNSKA
ncbi:MAG: flagellar protein FlaG [Psychrobium sp.]|nr:flagellar protein FlaG [Psychrobium sp.]